MASLRIVQTRLVPGTMACVPYHRNCPPMYCGRRSAWHVADSRDLADGVDVVARRDELVEDDARGGRAREAAERGEDRGKIDSVDRDPVERVRDGPPRESDRHGCRHVESATRRRTE